MVEHIKTFFDRIYILWGIVIVLIGWIVYIVNWKADLESRVNILEVRGSPHLEKVDARLTVLEAKQADVIHRLNNIVEVMTRELGKQPPFDRK